MNSSQQTAQKISANGLETRPPNDAIQATIGDDGRCIATSSATYFHTNAGKISQSPPNVSIAMQTRIVPRQGRSRLSNRRKTGRLSERAYAKCTLSLPPPPGVAL